MRGFAKTYLAAMKGIQKYFHKGDASAALDAITTAAGDLHSLSEAKRDSPDLVRRKSLDAGAEVDPATLAAGHKAEMAEYLQPQKEVYDLIVDHAEGFGTYPCFLVEILPVVFFYHLCRVVQFLEGVDMSLLSSFDHHRDSDGGSSTPGIPQSQARPFGFGSPNSQPVRQTSGPPGDPSPPHHFHPNPSVTSPPLHEKFSMFFRNDVEVAAKHAHRVQSLGNDMCPRCQLEDLECNCGRLFRCAQDLSEYDLINSIADGYVDENPSSGTFGKWMDLLELKM